MNTRTLLLLKFLLIFLVVQFLAAAHVLAATKSEDFDITNCEILLAGQLPLRLRAAADGRHLRIQIPSFANESISTITYSFDLTLKALRMSREEFRQKFAGKKVLLVGEGYGSILPELLAAGAFPQAVDPIYAIDDVSDAQLNRQSFVGFPALIERMKIIREYLAKYDEYLFPGVAQSIPFPDQNYDFVISNMVLNNFIHVTSDSDSNRRSRLITQTAILESARVLKPGGSAIHILDSSSDSRALAVIDSYLNPVALAHLRPKVKFAYALSPSQKIALDLQSETDNALVAKHFKPEDRWLNLRVLTIQRKP